MHRPTTLLTLLLPALAACSAVGGRGGPGRESEVAEVALVSAAGTAHRRLAPLPTPLRWDIDRADVAKIEDPWERTAVRLVNGMIGEDRRQMLRHFGAPVLFTREPDVQGRLDYLRADERSEEESAAHVSRVGPSLLGRPLRDALRELPIAAEVEAAFDEFRSDHDPLDPGRPGTAEAADWGRLSLRVRGSRREDPVEIGYRRDGLRIGTCIEQLRVRFELPVWTGARASVAWRHDYSGDADDVRVELAWHVDRDTYVHVVSSGRMQFLDGPTAWSRAESPLDGTPGLMFYVERLF